MPPELAAPPAPPPLTISYDDFSRIPFPPGKVAGGAVVLTAQSQCPFKAFATARLAAEGWNPAEAGLTASQRGNLLHAVLHSVWAGPPKGIRTHAELQGLTNLQAFVAGHVQRALAQQLKPHQRELMPRRYLELEAQRLTRLVTEWLNYESTRIEFEVAETELRRTVHIAGLTLDLRLDRVDRLRDSSLLVIDYKSGNVSPTSWELPRPDDVQLPLYAGFALKPGDMLGGLVFARLRAGELEFAGRVFDPAATLSAGLKATSPLMKNQLTLDQLLEWRDCIEQLARDFLDGKAAVNPRGPREKTCERCGLQTLCRIQEHPAQLAAEDDSDSPDFSEAANE